MSTNHARAHPAFLAIFIVFFAMNSPLSADSRSLSLTGEWMVVLDEDDVGLGARWFEKPLAGGVGVALPGSLGASGLGHRFDPESGRYAGADRPFLAWPSAGYSSETRVDDLGALVPERIYFGAAWYERTVEIPAKRAGSPWLLTLERVKWTSRLWIDGVEVPGEGTDSLHAPHRFRVPVLGAGPHRFTLRIDNRAPLNIGIAGHGYGMETEPIWNGVAGAITLAPVGAYQIERFRVRPGSAGKVHIEVAGRGVPKHDVMVQAWLDGPEDHPGHVIRNSPQVVFSDPGAKHPVPFSVSFDLVLSETPKLWDEFDPALYSLQLLLFSGDDFPDDTRSMRIGFREIRRDGGRLLLNGTPLFLRGNLDCAIHPESEIPPTGRAWWRRVLGIHKKAGFNHIRFHTWCPPEVAFEVADELGLYLQVETAYWVDNWIHKTAPFPPLVGEDPEIDAWILAESRRIIRAYAHHPSFMFFCLGNEFGMDSDWGAIERIVAELRKESGTFLVSGTTARKSVASDEFWVTHATKHGNVRALEAPHTDWDFSGALTGVNIPVVSHETGQRQSWPDFSSLLSAFPPDGAIQPHNLVRLLARSEAAGVTDHRARAKASVAFAALLYKAEHEAMRRTAALDGYQLLMLHDFTGQGEAFVGLLDPFFREKPGISLDDIRAWNGPSVPLARMPRYTWTTADTLTAAVQFAHQGPERLEKAVAEWSLEDLTHKRTVASGKLSPLDAEAGSLSDVGSISVPLGDVAAPVRLDLVLTVAGRRNSWPVWVYPEAKPEPDLEGVRITRHLDQDALAALGRGESVLLLFHNAKGPRFRQTRWESTFWTGAWGWGDGLGLMCDPSHPALAGFPNEGHSDWQWRGLAEGGTCIRLDAGHAAASIVEQISTFHRPVNESFLAEIRVGKGRLLACGFDLEHDLGTRHAARALRASLMAYLKGNPASPPPLLTPDDAAKLFDIPAPLVATARADSEAPGYEAANVLDGDPGTIWHTRWGAIEPPHPHELVIELAKPVTIETIRLKARADSENGRIAEFSLYLSERAGDWGKPVLSHAPLENTADWQEVSFPKKRARFLRLVTHREVKGRNIASLAELRFR